MRIALIAAVMGALLYSSETTHAKFGGSRPACKTEECKRDRLGRYYHQPLLDRVFEIKNQPTWIKLDSKADETAYIGFGQVDIENRICFVTLKNSGHAARVQGTQWGGGSNWIFLTIGHRTYAARCTSGKVVLEAQANNPV